MSASDESFDLVVVGAGMAGLTAATVAAEAGARVLVLERSTTVGGNARVSGGYLWTLRSLDAIRQSSPDGDPELQAATYATFPRAVEFARRRGVVVNGPVPVMNLGRGYLLDMASYLDGCARTVEARHGVIARGVEVRDLLTGPSGIEGVRLCDDGVDIDVRAEWTLLATGGFGADADLRDAYLGPGGAELGVRSSRLSDGGGLRLALAAGAVTTEGNAGFYGHLVPTELSLDDITWLRNISLYHSEHSLLLDRTGARITDESLGDEVTNQALFRHGHDAILVWDEYVQREVVFRPYPPGSPGEDRFELVRQHGGRTATAGSLAELADEVAAWGFAGPGMLATIEAYNTDVGRAPERLTPTRMWHDRPLDEPPYYAVRCRPSVTFPHGGIRIDAHARALDADEAPVPGLLVAGADAGNVMRDGYSGGLALASTLALLACDTAGFG